jgi:hypothetical protein
VLKR